MVTRKVIPLPFLDHGSAAKTLMRRHNTAGYAGQEAFVEERALGATQKPTRAPRSHHTSTWTFFFFFLSAIFCFSD